MSDESNNPIVQSENKPTKSWSKRILWPGYITIGIIALLIMLFSLSDDDGVGVGFFLIVFGIPILIIVFVTILATIVELSKSAKHKTASVGIILSVVLLVIAVIFICPFISIIFY